MVHALKMLLLGFAVAWSAYAAADDSKATGNKQTHEQRYHDLLVARADAIGKAYQARHDEFLAGRGTHSICLSSAQRLRDAELALAVSADERLTILDKYWQELWFCEHIQRKRVEDGRIPVKEYAEATSRRLEAEIALVEALAGRRSAAADKIHRKPGSRFCEQTRDEPDHTFERDLSNARSKFAQADPHELRRQMLQADMRSFVSRETEFLAGRGTLTFLTDAMIRLRDTQLTSSKTAADRFAALEACWMALHQNEAVCLQHFAAGLIPVEDTMEARYARLAAERLLHDAWRINPSPRASVPFWVGDVILGGTPLSAKDLMRSEVECMQTSPEERAKAMFVCAQNDWDARRQKFREGRGFQWFLLDAARRRVDAELALATKPAKRQDCLKQYRQDLEDIEGVDQRRYENKLIQIQDLMDAKYARLDAEIRLAEAEHGK